MAAFRLRTSEHLTSACSPVTALGLGQRSVVLFPLGDDALPGVETKPMSGTLGDPGTDRGVAGERSSFDGRVEIWWEGDRTLRADGRRGR